jgi:cell division protein FtsL
MSVVVEPRARGELSISVIFLEIFPVALVVALLAIVGIVHVTSRVLVVKMGYQLSERSSHADDLARRNAALSVELATLKSPARLEAWAKKNGLEAPAPTAVIHPKR